MHSDEPVIIPSGGSDGTHAPAPPTEPSPKSVPAVRRATVILQLLARHGDTMSLAQIARGADVLPSTALQILRELACARLIAPEPAAKTYRLGQGLVDLARAVVRQNGFADIARPHLQAIATRFDVTATATAIIDPDHAACVASVNPGNDMSLNITVGGRVPLLAGAAGRCIAAYLPDRRAAMKRRFLQIRWHSDMDFRIWLNQVAHVRAYGFAEDDGLFARGVTTLAAPVFAPDGTVSRAIGIASITAALDTDRREAIAQVLVHAAADASRQLAG